MKEFEVTLRVESEHTYNIEANTVDEAEGIAEDMFHDGDDGEMHDETVDVIESFPVED